MKEELQKKLENKYPFMTRKESLEEQEAAGYIHNVYWAFGCECGDGWYLLLDNMCAEITEAYKQKGLPVDIVVKQIKEKFGTLRFYYITEGEESSSLYIDSLDKGTFRFSHNQRDIDKKVRAIVDKYCDLSKTVCEKCGSVGKLRRDLPWIQTLCDSCYEEMIKRRRK